jgi:CTP synthase
VIDFMDEQRRITDKGATMRLGAYDCRCVPARSPRRPTARADQRAPPPPLRSEQPLRADLGDHGMIFAA